MDYPCRVLAYSLLAYSYQSGYLEFLLPEWKAALLLPKWIHWLIPTRVDYWTTVLLPKWITGLLPIDVDYWLAPTILPE
jgi:hypothetical protein